LFLRKIVDVDVNFFSQKLAFGYGAGHMLHPHQLLSALLRPIFRVPTRKYFRVATRKYFVLSAAVPHPILGGFEQSFLTRPH